MDKGARAEPEGFPKGGGTEIRNGWKEYKGDLNME